MEKILRIASFNLSNRSSRQRQSSKQSLMTPERLVKDLIDDATESGLNPNFEEYSLHQGIDLVVSGNMKENSVKKHINNDKLNWRLKNYELCKTLSSGDLSEYNYIGRQKSLQKISNIFRNKLTVTKSCDATTMNEMEVYQKNKGRLTRNNQLVSSTFDKIDKNILSNEMNKTIKKKIDLGNRKRLKKGRNDNRYLLVEDDD
ncbi:unnamed protein product [Dracunculus medinensis]|uniref:Uncharacterized protein n=1 Tax=Dracunculus medinensis TaxID=318479 RepID=A0A0N4U520_DRAME|nr:unnamed protein product [Dracunculus medinensis]